MKIDTNYQTPINICEYMISLLPNVLEVREPTPGIGNLYNCLIDKGYSVELFSDYFLADKTKCEAIVMNPPFSLLSCDITNAPDDWKNLKGMKVGYKFLEEAMEQSDNIIALMPWFTISDSDVRMRKIREFGLISVTPLPRKTFQYARIQTVVLQLQKRYSGNTIFYTHLI
jgi:hypothetical protein